jgi:hypothetical protein
VRSAPDALHPLSLALTRWAERQVLVERLRAIHREIEDARAKLPAWANYGFNRIDQNGQPCGAYVGWPLNTEIIPPKSGECIVRPSTYDCRRDFALAVQTFGLEGAERANARAHMRRSIRGIVARLRERDRLHDAVGLSRLEPESVAVCDALFDKEAFFRDEYDHETPNILAGRIMSTFARMAI